MRLQRTILKIKTMNKSIKELEKEIALNQINILISLAELNDRVFEIKKLNEIKNYILKN